MEFPDDDRSEARSILKELVVNQYQAIVLGGAALASLVSLNPLPLLVWLGGELVLLPVLDSGPLRRMVHRRRLARARKETDSRRTRLIASLSPPNQKRYAELDHLCRLIEANYQTLHGISQAYLSEQRGKLDMILDSCAHRMLALERYEALLINRNPARVERAIEDLEQELADVRLAERARAALEKNLELKRRLLKSLLEADDTIKALATELDSMASLLEVLHQTSISMGDPQAVSQELDTIVRQSEDSGRVVREMEALLRSDTSEWSSGALPALPDQPIVPSFPSPPESRSQRLGEPRRSPGETGSSGAGRAETGPPRRKAKER
jgi:hypothetical protein